MKVSDKVHAALEENRTIFSFEYHPPRPTKNQSVDTFLDLVRRMSTHGPAFCDLTWGAGGSTAGLTLELSGRMQNEVGVETMMHLTVLNMPVAEVDHALDASRAAGVQNILALRGDPPIGQEDSFEKKQSDGGLDCALDLVEHIKRKHGDYFGIVVAGYPEAHPCKIPKGEEVASEEGYQEDLVYLKRKVDAGADMIITQLFYDVDLFLKFLDDCRAIGITCPILPGILPITTYAGFKRMTQVCRTRIPTEVRTTLDSIKDDRVAVRKYGVDLATEMCKKMLGNGVKALHFYTMNNETAVLSILRNVGLVPPEAPKAVDRPLSATQEEERAKKAGAMAAAMPQAVSA